MCAVTWGILSLVASGADESLCASCIDCLTIGALWLCAIGVGCLAGDALLGRGAGIVR